MKAWEARKHLLKLACDLQKGKITEALEEAAEALSKQSPMPVVGDNADDWACPRCGAKVGTWNDHQVGIYCRDCGQLLMTLSKWKGEKI